MSKTIEKNDMGPFVGMDAKLVEAISRYGTPPYRGIVQIEVRDIGSYRFDRLPDNIDGWISWFKEARDEAPAEYRGILQCALQFEESYYDSGARASLNIWYERPETDAEMTERVNRGISYIRESEEKDRREFIRLQRKFSPQK